MRKLYTCFLLLGSALPMASYANGVCDHGYGEVICSKGSVDAVNANGVAKMNGTTVLHHTQVNGSLSARNVQLNTLTVNGDATIRDATVKNVAKINGALKARNDKFLSTVRIASTSAKFNKCELKDILVEKINAPKQTLRLTSTTVGGNIKFNGSNGVVFLCKDSKIVGSVSGGKVIDHCK